MGIKAKLPHFRELDGLRGLAALAVLFHHFVQRSMLTPAGESTRPLLFVRAVASYGRLGVDVFFVLSGFLITSLLLVDRGKTNYFHNFYWKRALRILPVYLIHMALIALLIFPNWPFFFLELFFLVNVASRFHIDFVSPAWTLSIEEQFYLVWPQVIRRLRLNAVYYVAFALIFISIALRIILPLWKGSIVISYTPYRCDGLGLGAVLACQWFSSEPTNTFIDKVVAVLNSKVTLAIVVLAELAIITWAHDSLQEDMAAITAVNFFAYRLVRACVYSPGNRALAWLATPVPVFLGAISYSMYMYHGFVFIPFEKLYGRTDLTHFGPALLRFAATLAATVVVCTISLYAVERPVQRLRRFVLKPSDPDPAVRISDRLEPVVK